MNEQCECMVMQIKLLDFCCCCCCFFSMIQPRSCITPGDNTSSQSLLKSCCVVAHPVGESDGNLWKVGFCKMAMVVIGVISYISSVRLSIRNFNIFCFRFDPFVFDSSSLFSNSARIRKQNRRAKNCEHLTAWYRESLDSKLTDDPCVPSRGPWGVSLGNTLRFSWTLVFSLRSAPPHG